MAGSRAFLRASRKLMRRILVDPARARTAVKRGGGAARVEQIGVDLDQLPTLDSSASALCALDDALQALTQMDRRRA